MGEVNIALVARDCYLGKTNTFSKEDQEKILRGRMEEILGGAVTSREGFRRAFMKHENEFFAIVEEMITLNVNRLALDAFSDWVEVRDFGLGEKVEFKIKDDELYKVSAVANGLKPARRQKIYGRRAETQAFRLGIKIYEEFFDFITNAIDWRECVDRVSRSFNYELAKLVSKTLFKAYDELNTDLKVVGTYSDKDLLALIRKVEAKTGKAVTIFGCGSALDNIIGESCDDDKADRREYGYIRKFRGRDCVELLQVLDDNGAFVVPDDMLLLVPQGEKVIRMGFEGMAMVFEDTDPASREDMQVEFSFARMVHMCALIAKNYGVFKIA